MAREGTSAETEERTLEIPDVLALRRRRSAGNAEQASEKGEHAEEDGGDEKELEGDERLRGSCDTKAMVNRWKGADGMGSSGVTFPVQLDLPNTGVDSPSTALR